MPLSGKLLDAAINQAVEDMSTAEDDLHCVKVKLGLCIPALQKAGDAKAAKSLEQAEEFVRAAQTSLDDAAGCLNDVTGAGD